ncbi:RidA family protein [Solimonas marina]|uniref:RidA family protein n=1 Tax=Solimonas marina TaxID=2714601 RepID=A0A970B779_9GAMM|nr:RidA family protein [Solimonas marina]NKF20934.1 RidA family protein [Solimonas marina]
MTDTTPRYLNSGKVLPATLPFSEAVQLGNLLILSGQLGNLPGTLTLAPGGIAAETKQMMENIKTTLEAHGYSMANVIKCTAMLADMAEWPAFNAVYETYFDPSRKPARSAFGTSGLAVGARIEMECMAAK